MVSKHSHSDLKLTGLISFVTFIQSLFVVTKSAAKLFKPIESVFLRAERYVIFLTKVHRFLQDRLLSVPPIYESWTDWHSESIELSVTTFSFNHLLREHEKVKNTLFLLLYFVDLFS
jgi:hypothetical protein